MLTLILTLTVLVSFWIFFKSIDWFEKIIGASIPVPLNLIPFPAKWKMKFLPAIDFSKYSKKDIKDARFVKEINQNIRYRIQHELNKEVEKRNIAFR